MSFIRPIQKIGGCVFRGKRQIQEDAFLSDHEKGYFIVADGFGGGEIGLKSAKLACESVHGFLQKEAGDLEATLPFVLRSYFSLPGNILFNALMHANQALLNQNQGKQIHEKGGASALACFIDGDLLALSNVGVCSAWLYRNGEQVELVIPRSYGRLLDPTLKEVLVAHRVPLMALGLVEDLEPEIVEYKIKPGDWILMHTDGFSLTQRESVLNYKQNKFNGVVDFEELKIKLEEKKSEDNAAFVLIAL